MVPEPDKQVRLGHHVRMVGLTYGEIVPPYNSRVRLLFHILAAVLVACLVAAAFFSLFGKNWEGPWKSLAAYLNYFRRGSQQGEHSEPWYYYFQILFAYRPSKRVFWSEGLIRRIGLDRGGLFARVSR